jgi:hypothetical protein
MLELYKTDCYGLGTVVEVKIDKEQQIVTRQFKPNAITVSGKPTTKTEAEIKRFWDNEVYWIERFRGQSEWTIDTIDIDYKTRTITQPYEGKTLLDIKDTMHDLYPDIEEHIVEMYKFFKSLNVFKCNGSLSNLLIRDGHPIAFDFKWCEYRPHNIEMELKSYDVWLSKISNTLPDKLKRLL